MLHVYIRGRYSRFWENLWVKPENVMRCFTSINHRMTNAILHSSSLFTSRTQEFRETCDMFATLIGIGKGGENEIPSFRSSVGDGWEISQIENSLIITEQGFCSVCGRKIFWENIWSHVDCWHTWKSSPIFSSSLEHDSTSRLNYRIIIWSEYLRSHFPKYLHCSIYNATTPDRSINVFFYFAARRSLHYIVESWLRSEKKKESSMNTCKFNSKWYMNETSK